MTEVKLRIADESLLSDESIDYDEIDGELWIEVSWPQPNNPKGKIIQERKFKRSIRLTDIWAD